LLIEKPPQIQTTKGSPIKGIEVRILVITVAPQNDICPQGSTYPKNIVPAIKIKIKDPLIQTCVRGVL
jgi:hypothetical protein